MSSVSGEEFSSVEITFVSVRVCERASETERRQIEMSASYYKKNDSLFPHRYSPPSEDHIKKPPKSFSGLS